MIGLPTNGALMTAEQFDALRLELQQNGCERERAMYHQLTAMLIGFEAIKRDRDHERECRMAAEREEGELVATLLKMQKVLQVPRGKAKKSDLEGLLKTLGEIVGKALEE